MHEKTGKVLVSSNIPEEIFVRPMYIPIRFQIGTTTLTNFPISTPFLSLWIISFLWSHWIDLKIELYRLKREDTIREERDSRSAVVKSDRRLNGRIAGIVRRVLEKREWRERMVI